MDFLSSKLADASSDPAISRPQETFLVFESPDSLTRPPVVREVGSLAYASAEAKSKPSPWTKQMIPLYLILIPSMLWNVGKGIRANSSVGSQEAWNTYFGFDPEKGPPKDSYMAIGGFVPELLGTIASAPLLDLIGRKFSIIGANVILVIATAIQALSYSLNQWVISREIGGIAQTIVAICTFVYTLEIVHPSYRGAMWAVIGSFWLIGQIIGTLIPYRTIDIQRDWAWRIPILMTLVVPVINLFLYPWIPESPRWLVANDRSTEAEKVLTKFHGGGDPNSAIAVLELKQMQEDISVVGSDKRWWDIRDVFNTREARRRFYQATFWLIMSRCAGNAAITYFLPGMLKIVGFTAPKTSILITGARSPVEFVANLVAACYIDRVGRRRLIIIASICFSIVFTIVTPLAAKAATANSSGDINGPPATAKAFIAIIFIFNLVFNLGFGPIQVLYSLELLRFEVRAKAICLASLIGIPVNEYNNRVTAIALQNIAWRYYIVFIFWNLFVVAVVYYTFAETSGRTLEEVTEIFRAEHPVKTSLSKSRIVINGEDIILYDDWGSVKND